MEYSLTVHEGTKAVKINKLQQLTTTFESIRMSDDECFDEFYAKLNDIVNSAQNLMMLMRMDLMMNSLLQRLHTLPRTLEIFLGIITKGQEVKTMLNLGILGGMNPLK